MSRRVQKDSSPDNLQQSFLIYISFSLSFFLFSSLLYYYFCNKVAYLVQVNILSVV